MAIEPKSYAHVRLTVTDIDRSRAFYDAVLGLPVAVELPPDADEQTREQLSFLFGGVIYQLGDSLLGLRPVSSDEFDENRTGLDHVSFAVTDHAALESAVAVLDEQQVAHEGIKDIGAGWILEFRDPDGIALEVFAAKSS
jgi:glyoxylase I family protein